MRLAHDWPELHRLLQGGLRRWLGDIPLLGPGRAAGHAADVHGLDLPRLHSRAPRHHALLQRRPVRPVLHRGLQRRLQAGRRQRRLVAAVRVERDARGGRPAGPDAGVRGAALRGQPLPGQLAGPGPQLQRHQDRPELRRRLCSGLPRDVDHADMPADRVPGRHAPDLHRHGLQHALVPERRGHLRGRHVRHVLPRRLCAGLCW